MSAHIAVDMDDVVVDFVGGLIGSMYTEHGVHITEEQLAKTGWDLHPLLDPIIGYNWWTWLRQRERLWANFPAVPGAMGGLEQLHRAGHYLELVTSKPDWARHNVWRWLGKWQPPFDSVTIIPIDPPGLRKVDFTPADILIDDKPDNVQSFLDEGRRGLLFSRPHNGTVVLPENADGDLATRVDSWADILTYFKERTNGR